MSTKSGVAARDSRYFEFLVDNSRLDDAAADLNSRQSSRPGTVIIPPRPGASLCIYTQAEEKRFDGIF
jgi:hypothetical protein